MDNSRKGFLLSATMDYFEKKQFVPTITTKPSNDLGIIVVIPSYNEPNILVPLNSLASCIKPKCKVEVIVVVNHPENSTNEVINQSEETYNAVISANQQLSETWLTFFAIKAYDLPHKNAGVGLARQIGMDEAAHRFFSIDKPTGIIDCFDADSQCASNYLEQIEAYWKNNPQTAGCSIFYKHPTSGNEFEPSVYWGIAAYELHLRYYNQATRFIKFPFAYHTVGSSMACTAETYTKIGGMNRHKAGEDFYFLQKIIPHGHFGEINSTCVYPSPRASNRVPFGTGRAMGKYLSNTSEGINTYNLQSFLDLIPFFDSIDAFHNFDKLQIERRINEMAPALKVFLEENNASTEIIDARQNTGNLKAFRKRFFMWFDAFKLLKYLNYANETHYQRNSVVTESTKLLTLKNIPSNNIKDVFELLEVYRNLDLAGPNLAE